MSEIKDCLMCKAKYSESQHTVWEWHESKHWTGMNSITLNWRLRHWCKKGHFIEMIAPTKQEVIDQWNTRPSNWVKVSERLPEFGKICLWHRKEGLVIGELAEKFDVFSPTKIDVVIVNNGYIRLNNFIAWQEIEPYKGKE